MKSLISNELDTAIILSSLRKEREEEFRCSYGQVASLYNGRTSCTGFMNAEPNAQIKFAQENGLFNEQITL